MRIKVECLGALRSKQPVDGWLELADTASLADLLAALSINWQEIQLTQIDGQFEYDPERRLSPDQCVKILPYTFDHAGELNAN